ncbi:MAG: HYR domain-containing protein [Saprospirales bacterium]|nr:HYR domain-containing protein [Saprospirales bacterium]
MGLPLTTGSVFSVAGSPHTIEYEAEDGNGNTITCSFTVTVVDSQNPNAVCQDFSVYLDENGEATITAAQVDGGSYDNCDNDLEISIDLSAFDCDDIGENFVTLTVTDDDDNFDICVATVTVVDDIAPTIECPEDIVEVNDPGECGAVVTFADPVADDNCALLLNTGMDVFNPTGTIQTWQVPAGVTSIIVQAKGAQGGFMGGLGADITGEFSVTPGEIIEILVGEQGAIVASTSNSGGGGGGGSFVVRGGTPLLVAGGGAGGLNFVGAVNNPALLDGQTSSAGAGPNGGTAGNGGGVYPFLTYANSSGGGGFLTDGIQNMAFLGPTPYNSGTPGLRLS